MKQAIRKFNLYITSSIVFSVISSASILACIFIGANDTADKVLKIVFPVVFWIGMICEQLLIWNANSMRKQLETKTLRRRVRLKPGIVSFLQTEAGAITDLVFVISLVVFIILAAIGVGEKAVQYVFIFLLVLSFRLHCILNGKNFRYKKFIAKRKVDKDE